VIKEAQAEMQSEQIEWVKRNVANPEDKKLAISYKIRFVPTTIIAGKTRLVGVTTVEKLKEEIIKFKSTLDESLL
jgi:hypothetical protein